jgi:tRNA pseudouridine38-40 synthase
VASSVYQIRLSAKSFLWQQVRRIVGFLLEVLSGQRNETDLAILLDPESHPSSHSIAKPPPAPPEYLILEHIQYPYVLFQYDEKSVQGFRDTLKNHLIDTRPKMGLYRFTLETLEAFPSKQSK